MPQNHREEVVDLVLSAEDVEDNPSEPVISTVVLLDLIAPPAAMASAMADMASLLGTSVLPTSPPRTCSKNDCQAVGEEAITSCRCYCCGAAAWRSRAAASRSSSSA